MLQAREFRLLVGNGLYPYENMDSFKKMNQEQLAPKDAVHSKLTDSHIKDEDYEHAQNVWNTVNLGTMRGKHNLYIMSM